MSKETLNNYFSRLELEINKKTYLANKYRKLGFDPSDTVEISLCNSLIERVIGLLKNYLPQVISIEKEISQILQDIPNVYDKGILKIVDIVDKIPNLTTIEKINFSLRLLVTIQTDGVALGAVEGILAIRVHEEGYLEIGYEGPVRTLGGTGQALTIIQLDYLRKYYGFPEYKATNEEIRRWNFEIQKYNEEHARLQYLAKSTEVEIVLNKIPISIGSGSPLQHLPITQFFDTPRVNSNHVRGGGCLVLSEGFIPKIKKIYRISKSLNLEQEWLEQITNDLYELNQGFTSEIEEEYFYEEDEEESSTNTQMIDTHNLEVLIGRPFLSMEGIRGGFRITYGRSPQMAMLVFALNPVHSRLFYNFLGVATQVKCYVPSKGATITYSPDIEGPFIELKSGVLLRVNTLEKYEEIMNEIKFIWDMGEILISLGDFIRNNYLPKRFGQSLRLYTYRIGNPNLSTLEVLEESFEESSKNFKNTCGDNPKFIPQVNQLSIEEFIFLRNQLLNKMIEGPSNYSIIEPISEFIDLFSYMGTPFKKTPLELLIERDYGDSLKRYFLLDYETGYIENILREQGEISDELYTNLYGFTVYLKSNWVLGLRMGRPEKAKMREKNQKKIAPNGQIESNNLGVRKNLLEVSEDEIIRGFLKTCYACKIDTYERICSNCTKATVNKRRTASSFKINFKNLLFDKIQKLQIDPSSIKLIRGKENKYPNIDRMELLEKGILRAKYELKCFRDGTVRFDATNGIATHITISDIHTSLEEITKLGYIVDFLGNPLISTCQVIELFPQDIIVPKTIYDGLRKVALFFNELSEKVYGIKGPYNESLIGELVIGMAPHISSGIVGRIIGYTNSLSLLANPFFQAAKRRNCDGDEDSVMLYLDTLVNFSLKYIPQKLGIGLDIPFIVTKTLQPNEVDDEAHYTDRTTNLQDIYNYIELCLKDSKLVPFKSRIQLSHDLSSNLEISDFGFTHSPFSLRDPLLNLVTAYKDGSSFKEKLYHQKNILSMSKGVRARSVIEGILNTQLFPDILGNLRSFFEQNLRCTKCKLKYTTFILSQICWECGGNVIFTINPFSVVKYYAIAKELITEFLTDPYYSEKIRLIGEELETSLGITLDIEI